MIKKKKKKLPMKKEKKDNPPWEEKKGIDKLINDVKKSKKRTIIDNDVVIPEMQIIYKSPFDLKLWGKNPRLNDKGAVKLARLIEKNKKFVDPIILDQDGFVRAGNTRTKAARILKLKKVPTITVDWKTEGEAAMYAISNNKAHEFTGWDPDILAEAFSSKEIMGFDMSEMSGFSEKELRGLSWEGDEEFIDAIDEKRRNLFGVVRIKCPKEDTEDIRSKVIEFVESLNDSGLEVL